MKKKNVKQIAALTCVVLLVLLYLVTLVTAFLRFPGASQLFGACLGATIALPILCWLFIWVWGAFNNKHTIASLDIMQSDMTEQQRREQQEILEEIEKKNL